MNDNFYVYAWSRPGGLPFYIGKGHGKRDSQPKKNPLFRNIINKMRREGVEPIVTRLNDNLNEGEAFSLEKAAISQYGRRDKGTGILANMTDGGEGVSGLVFSVESREKLSASLKAYCNSPSVREAKSIANKKRYESDIEREKTASIGRRLPPRSNNKSGFKGVSGQRDGRWRVTINAGGNQHFLGSFDTAEEAAYVYDAAAKIIWCEDDYFLNFPNEVITPDVLDLVRGRLNSPYTRSEKIGMAHRARGARITNSTGYKGVTPSGKKWQATIRTGDKVVYLGSFTTPEDAAMAYDKAAADESCENYLNFPADRHS